MSLEKTIEEIVRRVVREEIAAAKAPAVEVTIAAFAAARSISVSAVRAAIREGRLPSKKYGRAVRIPAIAEIAERAGTENPSARAAAILGVVRGGRS